MSLNTDKIAVIAHAQGQTSSGKTYTMRGGPQEAGLIPLAVHDVFRLIEASQDREYLIRVSYTEVRVRRMVTSLSLGAQGKRGGEGQHPEGGKRADGAGSLEVATEAVSSMRNTDVPICLLTVCTVQLYNEEVNDLLAPENTKLPIHESKENGIYVCGLREDIVTGPDQVLALLEEGESNRHVGSTKMNDQSSRSHTLFRMVGGRAGGKMVQWGRRRTGGGEEADPICTAPAICTAPLSGPLAHLDCSLALIARLAPVVESRARGTEPVVLLPLNAYITYWLDSPLIGGGEPGPRR